MRYLGYFLGVMAALYWGEWWIGLLIYIVFCFIDGLIFGSPSSSENTYQQDYQQEDEQWKTSEPEPARETISSYAVLGIDEDSSDAEVRQAYRKMAKLYHPDLHEGYDKTWATERFRKATDAYENIKRIRKMA